MRHKNKNNIVRQQEEEQTWFDTGRNVSERIRNTVDKTSKIANESIPKILEGRAKAAVIKAQAAPDSARERVKTVKQGWGFIRFFFLFLKIFAVATLLGLASLTIFFIIYGVKVFDMIYQYLFGGGV
jgi:hypothetical protein